MTTQTQDPLLLKILRAISDNANRIKQDLIKANPDLLRGRYGLSQGRRMKSQAAWKEIERKEQIRAAVVVKARKLIEWSHEALEAEKSRRRGDMKMLTDLTLNWSPQRVMSKHRDFAKLCKALEDPITWMMLSRQERGFIADAVKAGER